MTIKFKTNVPFQGRIYVNGRAFDRRCSEQFTQNQKFTVLTKISMLDCTNFDKMNKTLVSDDRSNKKVQFSEKCYTYIKVLIIKI